jgi:hypothetical protein
MPTNSPKWRRKRLAAGLCTDCSNQVEPGHVRCAECMEKRRKYKRDRSQRNRAAGLCVQCGSPSDGKSLCRNCAVKQMEFSKTWRKKKVASGICRLCPRPAEGGVQLCSACRKKEIEYLRKRAEVKRNAGICIACSNPAKPGSTMCAECFDRRKVYLQRKSVEEKNQDGLTRQQRWQRKRVAAGLCRLCSNPAVTGQILCESCRDKAKSVRDELKRSEVSS